NGTSKDKSSIQCAGCDCCHPKRRKRVRTGISGMICDFDVYQGSVNGIRAKSELGLSGDVVMKLASTLPEGQNYEIYADNYFTCVPLVVKLLDRGIHYVGTARQVRLPNCNLEEEKSLKKKGRGSFDIRVEANHNICAVKWYDSRAVTLVPMKSRRWYVYVFWHTIILAVINAWLLCNRRQFQADLASSLILVNTTPLKTPKRGRPSSGNGSPAATVTSRSQLNAQKRPSSGDGSPPNGAPSKRSQPPLDVRKDLVAHFPGKTKRGRCRHCSKGYTNTQCTKCDVRLCFSDDRNCFLDYHIHIQ
ncbi:hypothetical protein F7725_013034, partial [Dissostichus mawsoni]